MLFLVELVARRQVEGVGLEWVEDEVEVEVELERLRN